jgi:hypothetical protein
VGLEGRGGVRGEEMLEADGNRFSSLVHTFFLINIADCYLSEYGVRIRQSVFWHSILLLSLGKLLLVHR